MFIHSTSAREMFIVLPGSQITAQKLMSVFVTTSCSLKEYRKLITGDTSRMIEILLKIVCQRQFILQLQ